MLRASSVLFVFAVLCLAMHAWGQVTFTCTANGRYNATACSQTYVLCFQGANANGTFSQWQYTCPGTSIFNPVNQKCSLGVAGC